MLNIVDRLSEEKEFFSHNFSISLRLLENGTVTGKITHLVTTLRVTKPFEGLYCVNDQHIEFVLFIDWSDVNLDCNVLTTFSGRFFSSDNDCICLILKWLRISESHGLLNPFCSNDYEILLDSPLRDLRSEREKILNRISFEIF